MTNIGSIDGSKGVYAPEIDLQDVAALAKTLTEMLDANMVGQDVPNAQTVGGQNVSRPTLDAPELDSGDLAAMLTELRAKMSDIQLKSSKEDVLSRQTQNKEMHEKQLQKIHEYIEKMKESKASGIFGKIFGWVAAIALTVVAVAAVATTGGAAAPLLAAALIGLTVMALQESGAMQKIAEGLTSLLKDMGMSEKAAAIMAQVIITAVIIAAQVACIVASGGTSAAGSVAATLKTFQAVSAIVSGSAEVVKGGNTIHQSVVTFQAEDARADSQEFAAMIKKIQAMMEDEMGRIEELVQQLNDGFSDLMQIMSGQDDLRSHIAQQMI